MRKRFSIIFFSIVAVAAVVSVVLYVFGLGRVEYRPAENLLPFSKIAYQQGKTIAKLKNKAIDESSGLAIGRANEGVFWTHNDSGDNSRIFAFNKKGEHLAEVEIPDANAFDWEDMCSYTIGGKHYIMIGDVGDNRRIRGDYRLYIIEEPKIDTTKRGVKHKVKLVQTIIYKYPDGKKNCESVAVDPTSGEIIIVTKADRRAAYKLKIPDKPSKKVYTLEHIADLKLWLTTAMDISPDGRRAIVLTYLSAYEYVRKKGETWQQAFSRKANFVPIPKRKQGESICYGPDGKTLYLTSEKLPTPLIEVPVKLNAAGKK